MARIINDNIGLPGEATSAATANNKFTDVTTATASINQDNVRSRGIGKPNISDTGLLQRFSVYHNAQTTRPWVIASDGSVGVEIVSAAAPNPRAEIDFGAAGITLVAGDMLRLHFTVELESHNRAGAAGSYMIPDVRTATMAIAFPMWDLVSNANVPGNYSLIPGRASLEATRPVNGEIIIDNYDGAQAQYMTDGCALFSYHCCTSTGALHYPRQVSHAMLTYKRPIGAPNLTVYRIGLWLRGEMAYQYNNVLNSRVFKCPAAFAAINHNLNYINMTALHMRNG